MVVILTDTCTPFRLVGRSHVLFVLVPQPPIAVWLAELDAWVQGSQGFFGGKPLLLDLSKLSPTKPELVALIAGLKTRNITIIAVEGVDPSLLDSELPPLLSGGRASDADEMAGVGPATAPAATAKHPPEPTTLLLDKPVRSGQSIVFTNGDVTVMGSVASGAEVIAGGSIHIYGTLLGRAMAGVTGNAQARIFCRKFNAELVAINGLYATVNDATSHLCGRPVQAWLDHELLQMRELN
ncbi:MAG TPA: septum formation inhibitor MinC [Rhizobiales bacterium]|nr:septum formation inhibitor MinC [Hyphomicrobiales bacterium]